MTLNIIVENSTPVRPIIKAICDKVGIKDYYILDPKSDDVERPFRFVLFIGNRTSKTTAFKEWLIPLVPTREMGQEDKQKVMRAFEYIKADIAAHDSKKQEVRSQDIPSPKELEAYLSEYKGCFTQLRLQDRRSIGIYPDGEKLLGQCDVEFHLSELAAMVKIKDLFNPTSISIKET